MGLEFDSLTVRILQAQVRKNGKKITNKMIADHCGVAPVTVSSWLSGKHTPTLTHVCGVAKVFNVSVEEIVK